VYIVYYVVLESQCVQRERDMALLYSRYAFSLIDEVTFFCRQTGIDCLSQNNIWLPPSAFLSMTRVRIADI